MDILEKTVVFLIVSEPLKKNIQQFAVEEEIVHTLIIVNVITIQSREIIVNHVFLEEKGINVIY
jgi:hypothetical protein